MHPAPSIIVFTTLSGLGYGLAAVLGLGLLDPSLTFTRIAYVLALLLICVGLLSSTLHLGNPQRAWRALSQWRWRSQLFRLCFGPPGRQSLMAGIRRLPGCWVRCLRQSRFIARR